MRCTVVNVKILDNRTAIFNLKNMVLSEYKQSHTSLHHGWPSTSQRLPCLVYSGGCSPPRRKCCSQERVQLSTTPAQGNMTPKFSTCQHFQQQSSLLNSRNPELGPNPGSCEENPTLSKLPASSAAPMSMPLVSQNHKLKPGLLVLVPMNNPEHQPDLKRSLHLVIHIGGQRRLPSRLRSPSPLFSWMAPVHSWWLGSDGLADRLVAAISLDSS